MGFVLAKTIEIFDFQNKIASVLSTCLLDHLALPWVQAFRP